MHTEPVVRVVLWTGVGHQFAEALLAVIGEPVHAPCTTHLRGPLRRGVLDYQTVGLHAPQRGVKRAVGERPKSSQQAGQPFTQLVAVHRRFEQKTEDGELQHRITSFASPLRRFDTSRNCIAPIYSFPTKGCVRLTGQWTSAAP